MMKVLSHIIDFSSVTTFLTQLGIAIMTFVSTYIFGDYNFALAMFLLICIDLVLAVRVALKQKKFSLKALFSKTIDKTIIYALFMASIWIITHIKTGSGGSPGVWADWIGYSWLAGKEFVSILRHITSLRPGFFPKTLMDKLDTYENIGKWQS